MALSSPGVEVKVINESFYTPAEPGTVPLIVVASAENKMNGSGTGLAAGTLKANANQLFLLTSQRDLADTFGDPIFRTDSNNNPIHAGELNEYGLHAAYSLLGVSNRAFILRADLDLNQLVPQVAPPVAKPVNGTYWLDTRNTVYGIFEWDGRPATAGGQKFTNKVPVVVTDSTKIDPLTGAPLGSVGKVGEYAVVCAANWQQLSFDQNIFFRTEMGWVRVGTAEWADAWPTIVGTKAMVAPITESGSFTVNGAQINVTPGDTLYSIASKITEANIENGAITADISDNRIQFYHKGNAGLGADSTSANYIEIANVSGNIVASSASTSAIGIAIGRYYAPRLVMDKHTRIPKFKIKDGTPRPTGSVWIKTTPANLGARWRVKRYNAEASMWEDVEAPLFPDAHTALAELDKVGGGINLPIGTVFVQSNYQEDFGNDDTPKIASFKLMRRAAVGPTAIRSIKITANTFAPGTYSFFIAESQVNSTVLYKEEIVFEASGTKSDADAIASVINSSELKNIQAEVDSQNRLVIKHMLGGDFRLAEGQNSPLVTNLGFSEFNFVAKTGTQNLLKAPEGDIVYDFVASHWAPLAYTASDVAPYELTEHGKLWYSSVIDEVDIMIHDGDRWVGYRSPTSPYFEVDEEKKTDPLGPIVSATAPERQSDDTELVTGDLWIDTSDLENFPTIYKFNAELPNKTTRARWIKLDTADQSTEDGIVFADARYNTEGANSNEPGDIVDLLESNFVDFDAPDPALYPRGMLLWNLRRSGFNVKEFKQNYVDTATDNPRYGAAPVFTGESMDGYYPHRWVTVSPNQADGTGSFGRKAQRAVIVQALQAAVNTNQQIRDEEGRVFNLIACPGYPELVGEMVSLNYDRGLTAFVVADTPARLTPDATSLLKWGINERLALEDNDYGLVSSDEYLGFFYPWGFTSDNFGNNVVVPPSHMMLRTIALNDQVAYPWFAPAGVRRGGITNATSVGYVDAEGEFRSVALNTGQRDTLASIKVNPITFITGTGLVNYGQYTRARAASALDRINVARLVCYLRRQLNALAKPYIFEPNDKITRDEIKQSVEGLLLELVGQRALYDFLVVCDESNNTPTRIDRNELHIDIAIEPVKSVEFIYIPLRLKNTGEIGG